jgi:hypothetical protein
MPDVAPGCNRGFAALHRLDPQRQQGAEQIEARDHDIRRRHAVGANNPAPASTGDARNP